MSAKQRIHKWHRWQSINMVAKSIGHIHIIAELKVYWLSCLVMLYQCWNHMTLMASWRVPMDLFVQDDENEIQHDFFGNLTLFALASASCDDNGIVSSTIAFIKSRWLKQCATYFWSCYAIDASVSVTWCQLSPIVPLSLLGQDDQKEM